MVKRLLVLLVVPAALTGLFSACANDLVAAGGDCFQAIDCQEGLVCIKGKCSNDLTGIISTPPEAGAGDATMTDGATDGASDGQVQDVAQPDTGTKDSGTPDTGTPDSGGQDSGGQDSGSQDAASE